MRTNILEVFKMKSEVLSVNYVYQYNGGKYIAIADDFLLKMSESMTYAQLEEIAEQNNCTVGKESVFEKNKYTIYVSKTSELNAIQMANLFFELGFFEWVAPNFITIDAFNV